MTDHWTAGWAILHNNTGLIKDQADADEPPRVIVYGSTAEAEERIAEMLAMFPENTYQVVELTWTEEETSDG